MAKVAPLGAVIATTGSVKAGPPPAPTDGVTVTVPVEPASAFVGDETPTASTGAATQVIVVPVEAAVAPSDTSDSVVVVESDPGEVPDAISTMALTPPSAVPAGTGSVAVDVQVSVSFATLVVPSTQV